MATFNFLLLVATAATSFTVVSSFLQGPNSVVEVLVVLDKKSHTGWKVHADRAGNTVEEEVASMVLEASKMFEAVGIELRIKGDKVVVLSEDILPSSDIYNGNWYESKDAVKAFEKYLDGKPEYKFDVAILMVGYDLAFDGDRTRYGWAYIGTACSRLGIGVVENLYDMTQAIALAHEIGHILNSTHDGTNNNCHSHDGYIMTVDAHTKHSNFATFSLCSAQAFRDLMATADAWCAKDTSSSPIKAKRLGELVSADEVCIRREGVSSYVSRLSKPYPICQSIACETSLTLTKYTWSNNWQSYFAPQGMPCGSKMSCDLGKCVRDDTVEMNTDEKCLFGDTPLLVGPAYSSCKDVQVKEACNMDHMKKICCQTC